MCHAKRFPDLTASAHGGAESAVPANQPRTTSRRSTRISTAAVSNSKLYAFRSAPLSCYRMVPPSSTHWNGFVQFGHIDVYRRGNHLSEDDSDRCVVHLPNITHGRIDALANAALR